MTERQTGTVGSPLAGIGGSTRRWDQHRRAMGSPAVHLTCPASQYFLSPHGGEGAGG